MAKALDPRNKANTKQVVRAGGKVAKAKTSKTAGFSLKPEKTAKSAVETAAMYNPKDSPTKKPSKDEDRACKEPVAESCGDQEDGNGGQAVESSETRGGATPEAMGNFVDLSLTGSTPKKVPLLEEDTAAQKALEGLSQDQLRATTPEAMGEIAASAVTASAPLDKFPSQEATFPHNGKARASQHQLRAPLLEAMGKNVPPDTSLHGRCSEFFKTLHQGNDLASDVVALVAAAGQVIEIPTTVPVLKFFLQHAPFAISLQDAMAIILKRSQSESFSAPGEWVNFIKQGKEEVPMEQAMVAFA